VKNENNPVVGTKTAMQILADKIKQRMDLLPDDPVPSERAAYDAYLNCLNWCNGQLELERKIIEGSIVQGIMKDHNLPYGIEYLGKVADAETYAENFYNSTYKK